MSANDGRGAPPTVGGNAGRHAAIVCTDENWNCGLGGGDVDLELCVDALCVELQDDKNVIFVGYNIPKAVPRYVETLSNLGVLRKALRTQKDHKRRLRIVQKWFRIYRRDRHLWASLQGLDNASK